MDMEAVRSLARWDALSALDEKALARAIAERLPATFAFTAIFPCAIADHERHIAYFDYQPDEKCEPIAVARFALIPVDSMTTGPQACACNQSASASRTFVMVGVTIQDGICRLSG